MNKKKLLKKLVLPIFGLAILPTIANAEVNKEEFINMIVPDGKTLTLKSIKPTTYEASYELMNSYVQNHFDVDGYNAFGDCNPEDPTECIIGIQSDDIEWGAYDPELGRSVVTKGWQQEYQIAVTYETQELTGKSKEVIENLVSSLDVDLFDETTYFKVEDLSLINYYLTGDKSELWNPGAASRAIKFSNANKLSKGANISYELSIGLGIQGEDLMFETAGGGLIIYYNGYAEATTSGGIYLRRVIYIPESTEDTTEAYIKAAQKRINEYLGTEDVKVTLGGALTTLADNIPETSNMYGSNYEDLLDPQVDTETTDGNYYNIKVGNRTYKFYIIKSSEIPETPTYNALNLNNNISITSTDSSIPLDTTITVEEVEDNTLEDKIGTSNYKSYDITLYSDAKGKKIEKLENGKFKVSIPVPEELKGKDIVVYYVSEDGTKEEHAVTVTDDGFAVFETNHFSVYTLAEKPSISPKTGDSLSLYLIILSLGITGFISLILISKKREI